MGILYHEAYTCTGECGLLKCLQTRYTTHTQGGSIKTKPVSELHALLWPIYYVSRNEKGVEDGTKGATIPLQTWWKQEDSCGIGLKNLVVFV